MDLQTQIQYFADPIPSYYEQRNLSHAQVLADMNAYDAKWPSRSYLPDPKSVQIERNNSNIYAVKAHFYWTVGDYKRAVQGYSWMFMQIDMNSGSPTIVSVTEQKG
jgi:hypothetical protein